MRREIAWSLVIVLLAGCPGGDDDDVTTNDDDVTANDDDATGDDDDTTSDDDDATGDDDDSAGDDDEDSWAALRAAIDESELEDLMTADEYREYLEESADD